MPRIHRAEGGGRGAIVLAAGGSTRMGRPKALLDWGGEPLARAWVGALAPWADRVVVVVGSEADRLRTALPGLELVENPAWRTGGMIASVGVGLRALGPGPAWVTPVDVPLPGAAVFAALAAAGAPAVPWWGGVAGHPVLLGAQEAARILAEPPPTLRDALQHARRVDVRDPRVASDFDDPAAWARWRPPGERDG